MSLWDRLKRALAPLPSPPPQPSAREAPPSEEEALRRLLERAAAQEATALASIGDPDFWSAVSRLTGAGRSRTAIELLGRFVRARPELLELKSRLAELLCELRDDVPAKPILEELAASPPHALRAEYLLAEIAERAGDRPAARRHLEAILAVDLDHPKARAHADRLRPPPLANTAILSAAPTLDGLPDGGAPFAGRYRLLRELGRGASGAVYVAHDQELDRELAIKILHPHTRAEARAETRARAWLEARVAAAIRHPGVVAIYDLDEERQLLAMELCGGGALKSRLAEGPLAPWEALARARELCATLAAVHQRGVVHGDVKPGNLLFRGDDLVLGDFGVARLIGEKPVLDDRSARGTLGYMPPEQRRGELAPPADLYAAGVILVEMLCGSAALERWLGDRGALLRGQARWNGELPASIEPALGGEQRSLQALLGALLDEDATRRPTAAAAGASLSRLVSAAARSSGL